jgi:hypothetical protein
VSGNGGGHYAVNDDELDDIWDSTHPETHSQEQADHYSSESLQVQERHEDHTSEKVFEQEHVSEWRSVHEQHSDKFLIHSDVYDDDDDEDGDGNAKCDDDEDDCHKSVHYSHAYDGSIYTSSSDGRDEKKSVQQDSPVKEQQPLPHSLTGWSEDGGDNLWGVPVWSPEEQSGDAIGLVDRTVASSICTDTSGWPTSRDSDDSDDSDDHTDDHTESVTATNRSEGSSAKKKDLFSF